jgi:hypothetical protein
MDKLELFRKLSKTKAVCIKDDFDECAMKFVVVNEEVCAFGKSKGGKERNLDFTSKYVYDSLLDGNEITEQQYEKF